MPDGEAAVDDGRTVLGEQSGASVVLFPGSHVEKSGHRVLPSEAAAMRLVERHTSIPCPRVVYDSQGFIAMTISPGVPLRGVWNGMGIENKRKVCRHVWHFVDQLRLVPKPSPPSSSHQSSYACSADGSHPRDILLACPDPSPLTSDDSVRVRIYQNYLRAGGRLHEHDLPALLPRSSGSVFTHGDLAMRNLLVSEHDPTEVTGLVDWENAGWYPDYWELANVMGPACRDGDWQDRMEETAPEAVRRIDLRGIKAARKVLF